MCRIAAYVAPAAALSSLANTHLIALEPLDDGPEWKEVPADQLVRVTADSISTTPLE